MDTKYDCICRENKSTRGQIKGKEVKQKKRSEERGCGKSREVGKLKAAEVGEEVKVRRGKHRKCRGDSRPTSKSLFNMRTLKPNMPMETDPFERHFTGARQVGR